MKNNESLYELRYEFAPLGSGTAQGISNSRTTTFDKDVIRSVVRESLQNAIDARDKKKGQPVFVKFGVQTWEAKDLPNYEDLRKIFKACAAFWHNDDYVAEFCSNAKQCLTAGKSFETLVISDYNTTGLTGADDDMEGNYYNFMRAQGGTNKRSNGLGSFGQGKDSLTSGSAFKTIFVASAFEEEGQLQHVFQGKSLLMTFLLNGEKTQAEGSYGLEGQLPARDPSLISDKFLRSEPGTDLYVPALRVADAWQDRVFLEVLNSFWMACSFDFHKIVLAPVNPDFNEIVLENVEPVHFT